MSQASLRRLCVLVGALALLVVLPLRASAQSNMDFALGYAVMHDSDAETNFPLGWFASIGAPMSPRWGIAGDISGSYKTIEVANIDAPEHRHVMQQISRTRHAAGQPPVHGEPASPSL